MLHILVPVLFTFYIQVCQILNVKLGCQKFNWVAQMKMCLIAHQTVVWQVWIFIQYSMKLMTKLQLYLFVLITQACTICSLYCWIFRSLCRMHLHSCQTCLTLEQAYMQITSDCGRQTQILGHCSRVCKLRTANQVTLYTWQSLFHTLAFRISGLHLEIAFLLIPFTVKSALTHCNKEFHSIYMFS